MIRSRSVSDPVEWNETLTKLPSRHLLQTWQWGEFKTKYGWRAERLLWEKDGEPVGAAQVLTRSIHIPLLPLNLSISYCPKGPLLDWDHEEARVQILTDLENNARSQGVIFLKIDPNINVEPAAPPDSPPVPLDLQARGWQASREQIQFRNTLLLDLQPPEEDLFSALKQKTRYNIRLATRKGVTTRTGNLADLDLLYSMYAETAIRDGFAIRHRSYYQDAWGAFIQAGLAVPFIAEVDGTPAAAAVLFHFAGTALYMYGMSRDAHRSLMPTYLIQWEMIRWAREHGCTVYDFWGAPDVLDESDTMWGVYRFKAGFNPDMLYTPGALDFPVRGLLYPLYTRILPGVFSVWRRIGKRQTTRELASSPGT